MKSEGVKEGKDGKEPSCREIEVDGMLAQREIEREWK